jgi:hypothetical protein
MIATNSLGVEERAKGLENARGQNLGTPEPRNQQWKRKCQLAERRTEAA